MPEQRLQKCRDAYVTPQLYPENWTMRPRTERELFAIADNYRPRRVNLAERRESAAFRITQAQQAHDKDHGT